MPISFIPYTAVYGPLSVGATCSFWLDGLDPNGTSIQPANGTAVTTWADKSGRGYLATKQTGTIVTSPTGVYFNGSGYLTAPGLAGNLVNTPFVVFCVDSVTGTGAQITFGDLPVNNPGGVYTDNNMNLLYRSQTNFSFSFYNDDLDYTGISGSGIMRLWACYLPSASNRNTRLNGSVVATHTNFTQAKMFVTPSVGAGNGGNYYTGTISEIIVFPSDIGLTAIRKVEGYLAQKWGLTSQLPPGHPGLTQTLYNGRVYQPQISLKPAPYANYYPLSIGGCQLWLDGADSTTVTGTSTVTAWRDKSGLNYTMTNNQGTCSVSAASLNGLNTIYVPSGANLKLANFLFYTNFTTFIVGKSAAARLLIGGLFGTNGVAFYEFTGNNDLLAVPLPSGTTFLDVYDNVGVPVSANTWFIWCIGYDNLTNSTASPYRVNGNTRTTAAGGGSSIIPSSSGTGSLYLNSLNGANSYDSDFFAEIIHYNTTLTTTQCQGIEGYLAWKWGLQSTNLPVSHPYYSAPPLQYTRGAILGAPIPTGIARLPPVVATGGTITFSGRYKIHTFTTVGSTNFTITSPYVVQVQALIVGGGGGGGGDRAAGGGGGGLIFLSNTTITPGTYAVTVGDGGLAGWWGPNGGNGRVAGNGGNSIFNGNIAIGGGGAGQHQYYLNGVYQSNGEPYYGAGRAGGSGGGGAGPNPSYPTALGGSPTVGQGYAGGSGYYNGSICCAGGGGGAGGPGGNGLSAAGGAGGPGLQITIGGTTAYYAGGGGGAAAQDYRAAVGGAGGVGGGGQADQSASVSGTAGTNGLGGGGGGAGNGSGWAGSSSLGGNVAGFAGGSGVVIIAYDYL